MKSIVDELRKKKYFYSEQGATAECINAAEEALGLRFDKDYKEYLLHFGSVSCGGHELTGISKDENLCVVKVTMEERQRNPYIKQQMYVVEETHIDGIVIWQAETGELFQSAYMKEPEKICNSLLEYVSSFEEEEKKEPVN